MWYLSKLKIEKFISHLNSEYEFVNGRAVLIVGENLDDDSQSSNGSGKSAIIEAIFFALTGDSFRKVRAVDLIMNGEKESRVILMMNNTQTKQTVVIERMLFQKRSSQITIEINGKEKTDIPNVNEYDKFILSLLDISKEDLMNYFIVSKEKYSSFLNASDSKKKEIISRFSGASLIKDVDDEIEKDEKVLADEISKLSLQESRMQGKIEVLEEQLINVISKKDFEKKRKERISEIEVDKKSDILAKQDLQIKYKALISDTEKLKKEVAKISTKQYEDKLAEHDKKIKEIYQQVKELKAQKLEMMELIEKINTNLAGIVTCPNCNYEFSPANKDFDVNYAKEVLPTLKEDVDGKEEEIGDLVQEEDDVEVYKTQVRKMITDLKNKKTQIEQEIFRKEQETISVKRSISIKEKQIEESDATILAIKEEVFQDETSAKKAELKELKEELVELQQKIQDKNIEKQAIVEWYYNFKKFRTYLANKSIKSVEAYTNMFLTKMKTNLNIKVDGYKLLANGQLKENITIEVLRNGLIEGLFDKFSSGEKTRVDIATIFSLQKLINLNSNSGGLDLLVLDEIIESVDATGVSEILKNINQLNQTVLVITHASQVSEFDSYTRVVKEDGYSKII